MNYKKCKKCEEQFKVKVEIGGKVRNLQSRKFCLICSPFGLHNTRTEIIGEKKVCGKCKLSLNFTEFYKRGKNCFSYCKKCFNEYTTDRWIALKIKAVEFKGNKCTECGIEGNDSNYAIFDFHHVISKTKDFSWKKGRLKSWDKIERELLKCVLLCSNCHRIHHSKASV